MEIANLIIRPFQLFFVAVVLGLSIALAKEQVQYAIPSITVFSVACGVIGAFALFTGLAAVFVEKLQGLIMLVIDGIATLFFFTGAIALAVKLGVHSCTSRPDNWNSKFTENPRHWTPPNPYCALNPIIAGGGTVVTEKDGDYNLSILKSGNWFVSRCRMAQALDAFMFFAFLAFAASLAFDALRAKRKRSG